jgi:MFS transporter, FSR family, fosmidomycin resistance protein
VKITFLGHSANDLFWFILPLILPSLLARFDLSYTQGGGILTLYLGVTAVGSYVLGRVSDRVARKEILGYGFLVASVGLIAAGFAGTLSLFLLLIAVTAVGVSTFHPVSYALIDESTLTGKGRVLGIFESYGTAAILAMFLINGYLIESVGVRGVLILTALPALIMGILFLRAGQIPVVIVPPVAAAAAAAAVPGRKPRYREGSYLVLGLFLAAIILRVLSVSAVVNFLPTIFVDHIGFGRSTASYATALYFLGGLSGSLVAARYADRVNSYLVLIVASLMLIAALTVFSLSVPKLVYPFLVLILGIFGSGSLINQNLLLTRLGTGLGKGAVFGLMMALNTVTSSLAPTLFGLVTDTAGFTAALSAAAFPVSLGALLLSFLWSAERSFQKRNSVVK